MRNSIGLGLLGNISKKRLNIRLCVVNMLKSHLLYKGKGKVPIGQNSIKYNGYGTYFEWKNTAFRFGTGKYLISTRELIKCIENRGLGHKKWPPMYGFGNDLTWVRRGLTG